MRRIRFDTQGYFEPHVALCENILITAGYERTEDKPDFIIAGSNTSYVPLNVDTPTILLSSGGVYSCLSSDRKIVEEPFSEHDALVIPATHSSFEQLSLIQKEGKSRLHFTDNAVLRLFSIYGPGIRGTINDLFHSNTYKVLHSETAKNTYLYIDDFRDAFLAFTRVFIQEGVRGIYNLGSTEVISNKNLVESIHQTRYNVRTKPEIEVVSTNQFVNMWNVPNMVRFAAITGFNPKVSLRKGLFLTHNATCNS